MNLEAAISEGFAGATAALAREMARTEKCPIRPMEFNVVVEIDPVETITKGGIHLPDTKTERDRLGADEGTLVAVSPHAFTYAEWPAHEQPPGIGARVVVARFNGILREMAGKTYRIVKDKDVVAVLTQGEK